MKFKSLILDIDGTIWNTTFIVAEAWNKAISETSFPVSKVTAEILQKEFGKPMDVIAEDLWPELNEKDREKLLKLCCVREHEAIEANVSDITYPDVVKTIKALSEKIDFYVVSNCQSGYIQLMMRKTGIEPFIKDFICFGDNGNSKAENISLIVKKNNLVPAETAYVGDTQGDCNSCIEAAIPFIWAGYGFGTASSFVEKITEFSQLKALV